MKKSDDATDVTTDPACGESLRRCDAALVRAFQFLGKRWSGVILATLATGASGFADLRRRVGGISDSMLSDRLGELQAAGLVVRVVLPGPPIAVSYRLSAAGSALVPALGELSSWALAYLGDEEPSGASAS